MTGRENPISVLLDENVDRQVLAYLRAEGHEGEHVVDALDTGVADRGDIAPYARKRDHVVVTKDTGFWRCPRRTTRASSSSTITA